MEFVFHTTEINQLCLFYSQLCAWDVIYGLSLFLAPGVGVGGDPRLRGASFGLASIPLFIFWKKAIVHRLCSCSTLWVAVILQLTGITTSFHSIKFPWLGSFSDCLAVIDHLCFADTKTWGMRELEMHMAVLGTPAQKCPCTGTFVVIPKVQNQSPPHSSAKSIAHALPLPWPPALTLPTLGNPLYICEWKLSTGSILTECVVGFPHFSLKKLK